MKVFIDADGCPVAKITAAICLEYGLSCYLLCDTSHSIQADGAETVIIDKGTDSVDFALVNRCTSGDFVITQDYGLAAMCLAKGCRVFHQDGWEYTESNIEALLNQRHQAVKIRRAGGRLKGPKRRELDKDILFSASLRTAIQKTLQG